MNTLTTSLLRSLLGNQPASTSRASGSASGMGVGSGLNFASLLTAARGGGLTSDRPVEPGRGVEGLLSTEQLNRLAVAADHAESAGMSSALVLIDGKGVKLDVLTREVTAVVDPRTVAVTDIDGVLAAPGGSMAGQLTGDAQHESLVGLAGKQLLARLAPGRAGSVTH